MKSGIPSPRQLEYQDWEFGIFIHFLLGIYRRGEYRAECDRATPEIFNPTELDCGQWAANAAAAGAKYMVFTTKHHDGFCLWPSKLTPDFSTAAAPFKDGKGDVVREYVDACRGAGLKVGLYYSPYDVHCPLYEEDAEKYDDYFIGHMRELLGGAYGKIDIIWFDGAFSESHSYNWDRIVSEIRGMQKDILIFGMGDPDFRWIGNEAGIAPIPHYNTVTRLEAKIGFPGEPKDVSPRWHPAECDARIRFEGWSWRGEEDPLKSVDELMGLYYYSVGRGCNLLLNVGPDQRGIMHETDAARLVEFGKEIGRRFGSPLCTITDCETEKNIWKWCPQEPAIIDHAIIMEDIARGEHVERFAIKCKVAPADFSIGPVTLYEGRTIGHKAIVRIPPVKVAQVWLEVLESDGEAALRELQFLYAG